MNWGYISGLFFVSTLASLVLTKAVIAPLRRRAVLDLPNNRSSHTIPTPRGGGLAVVGVLLIGLLVAGTVDILPVRNALILGGLTLFLAATSLCDDLYNLNPLIRFGSHILAVAVALTLALVSGPFLGGLVLPAVELVLIGLGWVWFINLFNFMDGIDGIAATQTISIGLGSAALVGFTQGDPAVAIVGLLLAGSAFGFLPANWSPAQIFLGDVGSIPLGFLCAWLLLSLAGAGLGVAAFILSLVFFADATITLFKRLLRGEKIWQAHRQHFYQQAVQRGLSHRQTTQGAAVANLALIGLALWSTTGQELPALAAAALIICCLFAYYLKFPVSPPPESASP